MRPTDPNYFIGQLVGEIIHIKYLPTLETDMIDTNNRVRITDVAELSENLRLDKLMRDIILERSSITNMQEYKVAHANWLAHTNMLAKKYLPEKLECKVTQFEVTDVDLFKKGLDDYLWDCDVSWYVAKDDFLQPNFKDAWCTTLILTRAI
jgi:hypothetical protein